MLSLLTLLLATKVKSQSVCVTGRIDENNLNICVNGLYTYDVDYNGYKSYKKTTDCEYSATLYIYRVGSQWRISAERSDTVGYNARCSQDDILSCTTGTWTILGSNADGNGNAGFLSDDAMYAQADKCPSWDCASVTSTVSTGSANCQSFDTQVGANTYKNDDGYYWYFNQVFQSWRCINGNTQTYDSCRAQYNAATDPGYTSLSAGSTVSVSYEYPSAAGTNQYQVTCTGSGSNYPSPTGSPTDPTPRPTAPPTVPSSVIPSDGSYCIHGRSGANSVINGYWEPTGDSNEDVPTYYKTIGGNSNTCGVVGTLYLYVVDTTWFIGTSIGSTTYYAYCGRDTSKDYPACDSSGWYVYAGTAGTVQDTEVGVAAKSNCPQSSCSSITTALSSNVGCNGPFTPLDDGTPNAFFNSAANKYFYYVPFSDEWVCGTSLDSINTCPVNYSDGPVTGFGISCDGSPAPTKAPTTTTSTTRQPTRSPQNSNNNDTPAPTDAPQVSTNNNNNTPAPTRDPVTQSPTKGPTAKPTYSFCVSGRTSGNEAINGYYQDTGRTLGWFPVYSKVVSGGCNTPMYLYKVDSFLYIGENEGDTSSSSYLATCRRDTTKGYMACKDNVDWTVNGNDDPNVILDQSTSCTSTCTGTGTNAPTTSKVPTRSPSRGSNNGGGDDDTTTTTPQTTKNNNNDNNSNNDNNNNNKNTPSPQTSNTQDNTSGDSNILYKCNYYALILSLIIGLIISV